MVYRFKFAARLRSSRESFQLLHHTYTLPIQSTSYTELTRSAGHLAARSPLLSGHLSSAPWLLCRPWDIYRSTGSVSAPLPISNYVSIISSRCYRDQRPSLISDLRSIGEYLLDAFLNTPQFRIQTAEADFCQIKPSRFRHAASALGPTCPRARRHQDIKTPMWLPSFSFSCM